MARPTKLTPELEEKVITSIKAGNFRNAAARWAGIDDSTFRRWMRRGTKARKGPLASFARRVLEAEKAAEMRCVALVMKAAAEDARHAEWWLERKYPQRWGRKQRHEITGKNGEVIRAQAEVADLTEALADPQLRELLDAVAERAATLAASKSASKGREKP
jgi:hypothetical protein